MNWLALDIGGANLKAADPSRLAVIQPFPMWESSAYLADALRALIAAAPNVDHLAATMTGELADCFETKVEGVQFILQALTTAADRRHTRVYLTNGRLVTPQIALRQPLLAASSNWHALAKYAGRYVPRGSGMLIDIGSTTVDIIPLIDGSPLTIGNTDTARLACGELVYTGVERSPVCSLTGWVPWRGRKCPVAQEIFATTRDVYLTLGDLPEEPDEKDTADGRPSTKAYARDRLARMICADREIFSSADAHAAATTVATKQITRIAQAASMVLRRMVKPPSHYVLSGRGEFLARRVLEKLNIEAEIISLSDHLGPELSRCAAAHALAVLALEGPR